MRACAAGGGVQCLGGGVGRLCDRGSGSPVRPCAAPVRHLLCGPPCAALPVRLLCGTPASRHKRGTGFNLFVDNHMLRLQQ